LIVEDDGILTLFLQNMLSRLDYALLAPVATGEEAVACALENRPDLILMDIHMPVMDGYMATEQIRQWETHNNRPRLPIIALTADAYEEDRQHCLSVGMDDFLTKPIALEALKSSLRKWLAVPR
jgi:CheY-like chemotaxis protein